MKNKTIIEPVTMWADYVDTARKTNRVAVYATRAEQRANRPDLPAVRVRVIPVRDDVLRRELERAVTALRRSKLPNPVYSAVRVFESLGLLKRKSRKGRAA